ncbi:MAG: DUF5615 family PIN-like protein [Chloroflexi bacterium]|nr:DUF5615 family PIN-like protein [Chloroflexota bacterium]
MGDLYLDNDVSLRLAPLLRGAGHRVTTTRVLGLSAAPDDAQILTAARNGWILVTYNRRDFTMLHDAWLTWPPAFGLTLPRRPAIIALDHAPPDAQFSALDAFLAATPPSACANELFWWHGSGWRRRLVGTGWEPYS